MLKKTLKALFPKTYAEIQYRLNVPSRYKNLFTTIEDIKPATILEVGTWNGNQAVRMVNHARKYRSDVTYYGFDLFELLTEDKYKYEVSKKPPSQLEVEQKLKSANINFKLYKGDTAETLIQAAAEIPKVDFVYIDGGHSVDTIRQDWNNVEKLMHDNTVVIFDDYWRNRTDAGCKAVVDLIDTLKYKVEVLPEINTFNNIDFGRLEISYAKVSVLGTI